MDLKNTLNLPKTDFPMKAKLPEREPQQLAAWEEMGLYRRILESRAGAPLFVLHDGPPYPTGEIHLGTGLNKVLKDMIVKSKTMAGFRSPYIPGWDCHGLADRNEGRKRAGREDQQSDRRGVPPDVPRICGPLRGSAQARIQAAGRLWPVGQALPDDGPGTRGDASPGRSSIFSKRATCIAG